MCVVVVVLCVICCCCVSCDHGDMLCLGICLIMVICREECSLVVMMIWFLWFKLIMLMLLVLLFIVVVCICVDAEWMGVL